MAQPLLSVILPVHNASPWLLECLTSVYQQSYKGPLEISIYDDASTDSSKSIIENWQKMVQCHDRSISVICSGHVGNNRGVGFAKNKAVSQCSGEYLCFLDADDVMHEDRLRHQLEAAQRDTNAVYTSHGPTVIMPTWFCHRRVYDAVGGFSESGKGTPEDLLFFYRHLELGGSVLRVDEDLLMYRYHPMAETFSVAEGTLWKHRVEFLEKQVLSKWKHFSIWNAGKQGRKLYRSLSDCSRSKVSMFCDVDVKKIEKGFYVFEESKEKPKPCIQIVHFTQVKPPIIVCVKMNLSGNFEQNLSSLRLKEVRDYIHFN